MKKIIFFGLQFYMCSSFAQYTGTASVTQGLATTIATNLYPCTGGRVCNIGSIIATDNSVWTVPSAVNFTNNSFPFASDLYNSCTGANYANESAALSNLNGSDIITIDASGEVITAYIFADNYFEMYINGIAVGKDNVPYTQFNSNIIRFKVKRPFTIAILLVDWEENLGVGSENNNGFLYHAGDGGMVAVFKDSNNNTITTTGNNWKAQTFYTSPIIDLTCPTEIGTQRLSGNCSTQDSNNGTAYYGLHWSKPINWMDPAFNDSQWPNATAYSNTIVGVNNKPAYTNFINIFDDVTNDAQFIWSTNLILDNEVVVRQTVPAVNGIFENKNINREIHIYPNPAKNQFYFDSNDEIKVEEIKNISIYNTLGVKIFETLKYTNRISFGDIPDGLYFVKISFYNYQITKKLIVK